MMKYLLSIICSAVLFTSCGDFLNMVPEKDIETVESIFEIRSRADMWLMGVYSQVAPLATSFAANPAFYGADEFVMCEVIRNESRGGFVTYPGAKIAEGLQMSQDPYGNIWDKGGEGNSMCSFYESIRNCNTFLENIDNVYNMEGVEKRQWKAEIQALKAYLYFELVRRYGPICLVPENVSVDAPQADIYKQRSHVDTCFKAIVNLLDEASEYLLVRSAKTFDRSAYFSKEAAMALKARVLLYAASPLFNGNEFYSDFKNKDGGLLFSTEYDPEKWRLAAEAAEAAIEVAEAVGRKLYAESSGEGSDLLNVMRDVEYSVHSIFDNPEALLEWKCSFPYAHFLPRLERNENHYNSGFTGGINPSMKMVEMYYTKNGLPIDADNTWDYTGRYQVSKESDSRYNNVVVLNKDVLGLHLGREPRFYANIAADRTYWRRGPKGSTVENNLLVEAYKGEEFGTSLDIITSNAYQNVNGYWCKKHTYSNLQTRAYSVGADETFPVIRLAELYLIQAEAWNEYEGPSSKVYDPLNKVRERAGIPDVVTAWKSYSKNPEKVDTKEGMREIIRREIDIEFAFEGHRFFNLRRWKIAHEVLNERQVGWNILGENAQTFYNNYEGPVEVEAKRKFTAPRDYLFPIKAEEILISSIIQNPNW